MTQEALKLLVHEMEYVLSCINEDKIPFDGDDFHEALRLGKEALAQTQEPDDIASILACRDMLDAQPVSEVDRVIWPERTEQEPVAWPCLIDSADFSENTITLAMQCEDYKVSAGTHWLSTAPPQRTWVELTEEEIDNINYTSAHMLAREVLAKFKEKNT